MAFVLLNLASGLSLYNISKEAYFQYTNRIKLLPCSKSFSIFPFPLGYRKHFFALIQSSKPICPFILILFQDPLFTLPQPQWPVVPLLSLHHLCPCRSFCLEWPFPSLWIMPTSAHPSLSPENVLSSP